MSNNLQPHPLHYDDEDTNSDDFMNNNACPTNQERALFDPITLTAHEAILSKLSTSEMGYYNDPFLPFLAKDALAGLTSSCSRISSTSSTSQQRSRRFLGTSSSVPPCQSFDSHNSRKRNANISTMDSLESTARNRLKHMHPPVIRRGTHARVCVMDYAITNFLSACAAGYGHVEGGHVQIVMLGSGRDTTYLRSQSGLLHTNRNEMDVNGSCCTKQIHLTGKIKWYEVDHTVVIQKKHDLLVSCNLFDFSTEKCHNATSFHITPHWVGVAEKEDEKDTAGQLLGDSVAAPTSLDPYYLIGYNLLDSFESLLNEMEQHHDFCRDIPTLFVMECVQMYLPESNSREILDTITKTCRYPFMAIFDPMVQNDPFGKVMVQNLTRARIANPSMSLLHTTTLQDHVDKLFQCGFMNVTGCDFYGAYEMVMSAKDRRKANMTEMLDELEEWMLIMRHYCFLVAAGGVGGVGDDAQQARGDQVDRVMNAVMSSYCSVENGNMFGFEKNKCMTRQRNV